MQFMFMVGSYHEIMQEEEPKLEAAFFHHTKELQVIQSACACVGGGGGSGCGAALEYFVTGTESVTEIPLRFW
eukprot:COSAG01_NODE_1724_length_9382_cov_6.435743_5_plen_73_part_00